MARRDQVRRGELLRLTGTPADRPVREIGVLGEQFREVLAAADFEVMSRRVSV